MNQILKKVDKHKSAPSRSNIMSTYAVVTKGDILQALKKKRLRRFPQNII